MTRKRFKVTIHATVSREIADIIDELWQQSPKGVSKSSIIEELLRNSPKIKERLK